MNAKVIKLKEEYEKNSARIAKLQERNKKLTEDITEIENTDIIGMVREQGITPDMLQALLQGMKNDPVGTMAQNNAEEEEPNEE